MDNIKCFFECLIPSTVCNIKCSYCYVIQRNNRTQKIPPLKYSVATIKQALTKDRLGGTCYFSICAAGETLAPKYTLEIVKALIENGHYVNVTTNGTLTNRFKELESWPREELEQLHFAFSFHYLELLRVKKLDAFFENVAFVKSIGCSFVVQLNLCDDYIPYINEIKNTCYEHLGAFPQIAATRKEVALDSKILLETDLSEAEYINKGREFDSPLFDFTMKNFNVRRHEFCYAGSWAFQLNFLTGELKPCYHCHRSQNIFEDVYAPIKKMPVGNTCGSLFCMNSSHFMSLGVIPEIDTPSYADLRNRPEAGWYTPRMRFFLSGKLKDANKESGIIERFNSAVVGRVDSAYGKLRGGLSVIKHVFCRN